jgi:molecular chaperone GrpE
VSGDRDSGGAPTEADGVTQPEGPAAEDSKRSEDAQPSAQSPELREALDEAMAAVEERESKTPAGGDASEAVTEALISAKKELEEALEQTKREAEQLREKWMRSAADLENYRRRASKEREDVQKFGIEKLLKDFLPIVDDLDRALGMVSDAEASGPAEQLIGGVRLVRKKFLSTLEKHGVTSFDAKGETFNPERHEAVQQVPSDVPAGAVAEELQRGFLIHDRLLRPAMVVVSMGPPDGQAGDEDNG